LFVFINNYSAGLLSIDLESPINIFEVNYSIMRIY